MSTNTTTRKTVAGAYAEIASLRASVEANFETLFAALGVDASAPAKTTRTRTSAKPAQARKAQPKKAPKKAQPKVTKGAQTRETLSRKDWNRTVTAKARFAGGATYKRVLDAWADVQQAREAGMTPDEALALFV